MAFAGNLLWFVFGGGLVAWFLWVVLGLLLAVTIIGLPFAAAAFRIAGFAAFPFGRELVDVRLMGEKRITGTALANFLWIVLAGLWLAISHALAGISCCLTIIGIPFGIAHFKLAAISFAPLGKKPVSTELAAQARRRAADSELEARLAQTGEAP
jgi:uncharacterized membrane protein YccF (DUF307 family)